MRYRDLLTEAPDYGAMYPKIITDPPYPYDWMAASAKETTRDARRILKRNDRIVWFVRWHRMALLSAMCFDLIHRTGGNPANKHDNEDAYREFQRYVKEMASRSGRPEQRIISAVLDFSPAYLPEFEHWLSLPIAGIQNTVWEWQTYSELKVHFNRLEEEWARERKGLIWTVKPGDEAIINFGSGLAWWSLSRAACKEEGDAMGHCGNSPRSNSTDRIYSLRQQVKTDKGVGYKPYLTFILYDDGYLGEMKARFNKSPKNAAAAGFIPSDFQREIAALLKRPFIKGLRGGTWAPKEDFKLADLDEQNFNDLLSARPSLFNLKDPDIAKRALPIIAERLRQVYGNEVTHTDDGQVIVAVTPNTEAWINRFIARGSESNAMKVLNILKGEDEYGDIDAGSLVDEDNYLTSNYESLLELLEDQAYSVYSDIEKYLQKRSKRLRDGGDWGYRPKYRRDLANAVADDAELSVAFEEALTGLQKEYLKQHLANEFSAWMAGPAPAGKRGEPGSVPVYYRNRPSETIGGDAWWDSEVETLLRLYDAARIIEGNQSPPPIRFVDFQIPENIKPDNLRELLHDHIGQIEQVLQWVEWDDDNEDSEDEEDR